MTAKKLKRVALWILLNGTMLVLVYFAVFSPFKENAGLVRCAQFALWATSVVAWLILPIFFLAAMIPDFAGKCKVTVSPRSVPSWLSVSFDIGVVLCAIYAGWIWTAIVYFSHIIAQTITVSCIETIIENAGNAVTKTSVILFLLCALCGSEANSAPGRVNASGSLPPDQAVRAIVGEAANQGPRGMLAVAGAIRNRHRLLNGDTLPGVYGLKNPMADRQPAWVWAQARAAWAASATNGITGGATHWENVRAFGKPKWAAAMTVTLTVKDHVFYRLTGRATGHRQRRHSA